MRPLGQNLASRVPERRRGFSRDAVIHLPWRRVRRIRRTGLSWPMWAVTVHRIKALRGARSNGGGIYLFQMNPATGALSPRKLFADDSNPSWLAFDSSRTHLYATNEISTFQGTHSGSVSAFSIDRSNGDLTLLNTVSSQGAGPTHLSVHPSGKYVLVANFGGGSRGRTPHPVER